MFVKIMDPTGLPDTSPDASFQVIECTRAHICNIPDENSSDDKKLIRVVKVDFHGDGGAVMNMYPKGNIYLINDKGKTIASAGPTITVVESTPDEPESE